MNKKYVEFSVIMPNYRPMLSLMLILFLSITFLFSTVPFKAQAADESVTAGQNSTLLIDKSASPLTYSTVGNLITYTYNVTNTRNVDITGPIKVTDNKTGTVNITEGNLTPGQTILKNVIYTITQEDLDAGLITNAAYAYGTFNGSNVISNTGRETIIAQQNPALAIQKLANPSTYSAVRDLIIYTYKVTNNGNVIIRGPITITDNKTGTIQATSGNLTPGQSVLANTTYIIKQKDLNAGYVTNAAFAIGNFKCLTIVSNTDNETVKAIQSPNLIIEKSASPTNYNYVGQIITYTYNITNSGKMNITRPIKVTDNKTGTVNITEENLTPGQSILGNATYIITQKDIDAGFVTNSAFATGTLGNNTTVSNVDNETVTADQNPKLIIEKSASPRNYSVAGQTITYTYNVTNIGNVNITGPIKVTDNRTGTVNATKGNITPGQNILANSTYTITQADINLGFVTNVAFATGTFRNNTTTSNTDSETVTILRNASYKINKIVTDVSGKGPGTEIAQQGDKIEYKITVKNTGNVDLTNPIVTDSLIELTGPLESINPDGILQVGETWTCSGKYIVTQQDISSNGNGDEFVENTATVDCDQLEPKSDSRQVPIKEKNPAYCISKSIIGADEAGDCITNNPGDIIKYRVIVKNEGNIDLTGVSVKDSLIHLEGPKGDDVDPGVLNPREVWKFYGQYRLTQKDIDSNGNGDGYIENTATVKCNELPEQKCSAKQPILQKTDLCLYKSVIGTDEAGDCIINEPGDVIQYQIIVKNEGKVDLTGITVKDPLIKLTGPTGKEADSGKLNSGILKPGEIWKYTGNYTITQKDINSNGEGDGLINNTATIDCDQLDPKSDSAEVPVHFTPIYLIDKVVTDVAGKGPTGNITAAGQIIAYRINVRNVGNVDLTDVSVQDSPIKLEGPSGDNSPTGVLNVGETWTYTGNYTVTGKDISSNGNGDGFIENTATVSCKELPDKTSNAKQQIVLNPTLNPPKNNKDVNGGLTISPEPAKNIETKESAQAFVTNGEKTRFEFINNATCVVYVNFDAKKTAGKITTIVEMLKGKSELVSELPTGEVYKSFNVWVGNKGFAIAKNRDNAVICFKVEKAWIKENGINKSTITLNRYSDKKWDKLPTNPSSEDEKFLYFIARTPEFGCFSITGERNQIFDSNTKNNDLN